MATQNVDASRATALTQTPSLVASLNANVTLTVGWDLFVGHTDALKNQIPVIPTPVDLVLSVQ